MGQEITTTGTSPLAVAAYRGEVPFGQVPPGASIEDVERAIEQVDRWLVPLKDRDRRFALIDPDEIVAAIHENPDTRQMVEAVKMIGRKLRPEFSASQASHWTAAIVASLTDLPPHVAVQACKAALHVPFEFVSQVEKGIREKASEIEARYKSARLRLESILRELRRAASPTPRLPPPPPMTEEELQAMPDNLRRIGLGAGWLREIEGRIEWVEGSEK